MSDATPNDEQGVLLSNFTLLNRYLSPLADPTSFICRVLRIPNDIKIIAAVNEVLALLTNPDVWQENGLTAQETTYLTSEMLLRYFESDRCMIGMVLPNVRQSLPADFLPCLGGQYLIADYPELAAVIDPVYLVDATHFKVPNYGDRTLYGEGVFDMDDSGGTVEHTLTLAELPAHSHTSPAHFHTDSGHTHAESVALPSSVTIGELPVPMPTAIPAVGVTGLGFANISAVAVGINNAGGGAAHGNMMPYRVCRFCIVAK